MDIIATILAFLAGLALFVIVILVISLIILFLIFRFLYKKAKSHPKLVLGSLIALILIGIVVGVFL